MLAVEAAVVAVTMLKRVALEEQAVVALVAQ
jgi:hypothetical protein